MLVRPRFTDCFALVGIVLLVFATPAYVAQDEQGRDLSGGIDSTLPKPRDGMRMEIDMVATWQGEEPVVVGPVWTYSIRATEPGEVPVASVFVYEEIKHPLHVDLGWGVYKSSGKTERTYYDASGDPVWRQSEWVERDDAGERVAVRTEERMLSTPTDLNTWAGTPYFYHPSPERVLFTGVMRNGPREIMDDITGRSSQETVLFTHAASYNDHLLFAFDTTFHPWDGSSGPCAECQSHPEEIVPLSIKEGAVAGDHSRMDGYRWFSPDWPVPVGPRVWHFDRDTLEVFLDVDFVPRTLDAGSGRTFDVRWYDLWSTSRVANAPAGERALPQIRLGALEDDPREVAYGLRLSDLKAALLSEPTPTPIQAFADRARIVEFHWLSEEDDPADAPPEAALPVPALTLPQGPDLERQRSTWFLTLARPTGETLVVTLALERTVEGTKAREVRDMCGQHHWALREARCSTLAPELVHRDRHVTDPWAIYELAEAESLDQTGAPPAAFAYLPLYHMTTDEMTWRSISTARWVQHPEEARFARHIYASLDQPFEGLAFWRTNLTDQVVIGTLDMRDGGVFGREARTPATTGFPAQTRAPTSNEGGLVMIDAVGRTALAGGAILVAISLAIRLMAWAKAGGAFGLAGAFYAKIARPQVLDHTRREEIIEMVRADPGATASELSKHLGSGWGATLHHLETLVRNGYLLPVMFGGRRHYFTSDTPTRETRLLLAVRRDEAAAAFLDAVAARPGATLGELGDLLGRKASGLSRTGSRLVKEGLVTKRRDGMHVRFWATAIIGAAATDMPARATPGQEHAV